MFQVKLKAKSVLAYRVDVVDQDQEQENEEESGQKSEYWRQLSSRASLQRTFRLARLLLVVKVVGHGPIFALQKNYICIDSLL